MIRDDYKYSSDDHLFPKPKLKGIDLKVTLIVT